MTYYGPNGRNARGYVSDRVKPYSVFAKGDVVRLRGVSSPHMVVEYIYDDGKAACIWFNTAGVLQRNAFAQNLLDRPRFVGGCP